jgi:hypothetical protein
VKEVHKDKYLMISLVESRPKIIRHNHVEGGAAWRGRGKGYWDK